MTTAAPTPGTLPSDEELVPRLAARDEDAVALLLARWWPRAHRLALQLVGDAALAEDVAQEAFVQLLRAAGEFDPARGAFTPWFLRIVRNAALNAARARTRRSGHEAAAARPEGHVDDPAERAATSVDAASVRAHLAELSPPYREAVALHCLQGLTFKEVSQVLGYPLGTVASRVRRGLDDLRARLAAGSAGVAPFAPSDADLGALCARAFADVAAPPAPSPRAMFAAAASAAPARPPARLAPRASGSRAGALLSLAVLLAAGTGTFTLLVSDAPAAPPRAVVTRTPTPTPSSVASLTLSRPARPTGLASTPTSTETTGDAPPVPDDEVQPGAVEAVCFDRLGQRVAAGRRDGTAEVWSVRERVRVLRLVGHEARVTAVAFSPDGALVVTASDDGTARVWETTRGSCVHVLAHATSARRRVLALAVSPDGQVVATGGEDGQVRLWALAPGQPLGAVDAHERPVRGLSFDRGGATLLSAGEDHRLALWSPRGDRLAEVGSDAGFTHALLDRDGTALAAAPLLVERWDLALRRRVTAFAGEGPLALSPPTTPERDRGLLLRGGASVLRLVDPETGLDRLRLVDDDDALVSWALSPDGAHAVTGGESGRIKLWKLRPEPDEPPSAALVHDEPPGATTDAPDRAVPAGVLDPEAAPATTSRALPTPPGVDVDATRSLLGRGTPAERRALLARLDARDAGGFVLLLDALAGVWSDWTVRQAAVEAVAGALGDPRVQAAASRRLADPDTPPRAREGLTLALGLTGSQVFLGRLVALLEDREWFVRRAAAIALARLRDARSVEPLIAALEREEDPRASAVIEETLERLTATSQPVDRWRRWWERHRVGFEVARSADLAAATHRVSVGRGPDGRDVAWLALVRGAGRPVLVLPEVGYHPTYLATCLRWLERDRTVVYVDPPEVDDVTAMAERLDRLRQALVQRGVLPEGAELVVAHGLSSLVATRYAHGRPEAAGLVLVSPFGSGDAWADAVRRVEAAGRERHQGFAEAARLLLAPSASLDPDEEATRRRDLFTSYFGDASDLFIGQLLGERHEREELRSTHRVEHPRLPAPPRGHAAGSWHRVRTAVVVGRRSPWDSPQDAQRVALQARRSKVFVAEAGRMAFHEDHATFIEALRWLEE